jgi:Family of unknown function (DUF6282)
MPHIGQMHARPAGGMIVGARDASGRVRLKLRISPHGAHNVGVAQRPGSKHWADDDARVRAGGAAQGATMRCRAWMLLGVLASLFCLPGRGLAQAKVAPSLAGVIDIHAHAAPQTGALNFQRQFDAIQAAQIAKIYGMRGIVLKEHTTETASWAYLVSQVVPGVEVFGGIVLNRYVGGMNPAAVEAMALTRGGLGKVVYMPTMDAEYRNEGQPGRVAISRGGRLLPETQEVLKVIAKHNLGLSTGHVSPAEVLMLIRAARAVGVNKIYVQHPNHGGLVMSMTQLKEAAREGAMIEVVTSGEGLTGGPSGRGVRAVVDAENPTMDYGPQKIADIRALGPANIILSTDLGQPGRVNYAEAYQMAIAVLLKEGFTQAEIDLMTKTNPARFLGLQ